MQQILPFLPVGIQHLLSNISDQFIYSIEEIRMRVERPLMIICDRTDYFIKMDGHVSHTPHHAYIVSQEDCQCFIQNISDFSLYALEEELRNGFITTKGGYRIGIVGKAVLENGRLKVLTHYSGFNIRIARQIFGVADKVLPYMISKNFKVLHTLIISPPQLGKTTLLRDIARQISNGWSNFKGVKVGIIDERSEIAGCYRGIPQNDVGLRTDILDGCPKVEGMLMMIRSMSPQVIVTDEIGRNEDIFALEEALYAGVKVITSVHGENIEELYKRPIMKDILSKSIFERYIILGDSRGVGTVEAILDGETFTDLYKPITISTAASTSCSM